MSRFFTFLLVTFCVVTHVCAEEDEFDDISQLKVELSADCEPLIIVADCVNVQTGSFFQVDRDLIGNSIDPLSVIRYYDSAKKSETFMGYGFGSQFPLLASETQDSSHHTYAMICERDGVFLPYRCDINSDEKSSKTCLIDPRLREKGYTNFHHPKSSGNTHLVNWRAKLQPKEKKWTVRTGDGSKRIYAKSFKCTKHHRKKLGLPTKEAYLLTQEIKPNGNQIFYSYEKHNGAPRLSLIQTHNRVGSAILNELTFNYQGSDCQVKSSCGNFVSYTHKLTKKGHETLVKVEGSQKSIQTYDSIEDSFFSRPTVVRTKNQGHPLTVYYYPDKKVKLLVEPADGAESSKVTHSFRYFDKQTWVANCLHLHKLYQFEKKRVTQINYFASEAHHLIAVLSSPLLRQESFEWSDKGMLKFKAVGLSGKYCHLKRYKYDLYGNMITEQLYGNLTGQKEEYFEPEQYKEMDHVTTNYTYTGDQRNLVTEKKTTAGLKTFYSYLPKTNLKTKELQFYDGQIQERAFISYDINGQLSQLIQDDGSSEDPQDLTNVTYRTMKKIIACSEKNQVYFGKPKKILEFKAKLPTSQWQLFKSTEYEYNSQGNEIKQSVYNSQNEFCYAIKKGYDAKQRINKMTDPLKQVTLYCYDERNNKVYEEQIGSGKKVNYIYNQANKLVSKKESYADEEFITQYGYDPLHQLVSEIDPYGQETNYIYDSLGREIECLKPFDAKTNSRPTIKKEYNTLNQLVSFTNELGWTTLTSYNVYGQPIQVTYADGSTEKSIYHPCGWLKQKTYADGTAIAFTYDAKGRVLTETSLGKTGNPLKEISFCYKGKLLRSKKDAMGLVTIYHFDEAGRKISEEIGEDKCIYYHYDDFDRLIQVKHLCGEVTQIENYQYDWLDRVTHKTLEDGQKIYAEESYYYDRLGNQTKKVVKQTAGQSAMHLFEYYPDGQLKLSIDPLNHQTNYTYDYHVLNKQGQRVKQSSQVDALARITVKTEDIAHRLVQKEIYANDHLVGSTEYSYDFLGNLTQQVEKVMIAGELSHYYTVLWHYDSMGRVISEVEKPDGKATQFNYDLMGRLTTKVKPDGVELHYLYDQLGRVKKLSSSDQTIGYTYQYDLHDNPILITDLINKSTIKRRYNLFDQIEEEKINDILLQYRYDSLNRLLEIRLPDGSQVNYTYDAFHLKSLQRLDADKIVKYTHLCEEYDLSGNLLKSHNPSGETSYLYDLLGRKITIQNGLWKSESQEFDPVGNLLKLSQVDPTGQLQSEFKYDCFDRVTEETNLVTNKFLYDSIGNCIQKNDLPCQVNKLNQLKADNESEYLYDLNGNVIQQTNPPATYSYDALNRLVTINQPESILKMSYDAFGRCLTIQENEKTKNLFYLKNREIGSIKQEQIKELRLLDPREQSETVYAIELDQNIYFPIQDARHNIAALKNANGEIVEWYRYSAFGAEKHYPKSAINPWRFANRRYVAGLWQYPYRLYHPKMMRWLTTDPLGFEDNINLYNYVKNNPFYYTDPDGRFVALLVIPLVTWGGAASLTFTAAEALTLTYLGGAATAALAGYATHQLCQHYDISLSFNQTQCWYDQPMHHEQTVIDNSTSTTDDTEVQETEAISAEGKEKTVRSEPNNLNEQLSLKEAKTKPSDDKEIMKGKIKDPRYPQEEWKKCDHVRHHSDGTKTDIHFWENRFTGQREDFKFKN